MVRLACVDVADLSLQLLLRKHPKWREIPAAVVSKDSPYGTILNANEQAKEYGIVPGLRYAAGLSLTPDLRADTIPREMIEAGSDFLAAELRQFSPQVEGHASEPGVFWLDAGGLSSLYPNLTAWCGKVRSCLHNKGFDVTVAAGFSRFGCYAGAKSSQDQLIFDNPQSEQKAALAAGIDILMLPSDVLERLEMLGVRSVSSFLRLPPGGIGKRFGPEVERLYHFAAGALDLPLQPTETEEEPAYIQELPSAEFSSVRLLSYLSRSIAALAADVRKRHRLIRELMICFILEDREVPIEPIMPSSPSADSGLLLDLVALRLENSRLSGAVTAIRISALTLPERNIQTELFSSSSAEALQEVGKVFSRLRAIFGNSCVQRARLEDEHPPESSYSWEDLDRLPRISEQHPGDSLATGRGQAVRRIFDKPCPSPTPPFPKLWGPYPLSGRWWRGERPRDYYYAETKDGEILWLCFDRKARQWRQIGVVE